jgi:glycosyltransferase involved in cell wall biosynthesis
MIENCSVIIPCYNSSIDLLKKNITEIIDNWKDSSIKLQIIIVVDGDLKKNSEKFKEFYELKNIFKKIILLKNKKRLGQQETVLNGLDYCSSDIAITIDDDAKYPVHNLCNLAKQLYESDYECFIGKPESNKNNKIRQLGTNLIKIIFNHVYKKKNEKIYFSSFRLIKKEIYKNILKKNYLVPVISYQILEESNEIRNFSYDKNLKQKSRYSAFDLVTLFINMNIFYSHLFYKLFAYIGLFLSVFSLYLIANYLFNYFFSVSPVQPGFTTTTLLLLLILQIFFYCFALVIKYLNYYINFFKNIHFNKTKTYEEIYK